MCLYATILYSKTTGEGRGEWITQKYIYVPYLILMAFMMIKVKSDISLTQKTDSLGCVGTFKKKNDMFWNRHSQFKRENLKSNKSFWQYTLQKTKREKELVSACVS